MITTRRLAGKRRSGLDVLQRSAHLQTMTSTEMTSTTKCDPF
jgi:hypothetical protein